VTGTVSQRATGCARGIRITERSCTVSTNGNRDHSGAAAFV
jgi:hypothetical protein